jgi:formyltetrahydrofolate deformylase
MTSVPGKNRGRLLVSCSDQRGIVAAVSQFLFEHGANILDSDQHSTDPAAGLFFLRVEFDLEDLPERLPVLMKSFATIVQRFDMVARFTLAAEVKRVAIFVSKEDHCLHELLWQWRAGDLRANIALVVSNHDTLRATVEGYGLPFHHLPVTKENKAAAEREQLALLEGTVDLVVLARYMQILSPEFLRRFPSRVINIHHSFLPAFVGANPYAQAYERGVKLIGATAHYVTEKLDAGPIIEQDTQRVGHRDDVADLKRLGRHIERVVLARAVSWHVEDRVLIHGNKTVVFT